MCVYIGLYLEPVPITDTIYEESAELAMDGSSDPPPDGAPSPQPPSGGLVYYMPPGARHSVDSPANAAASARCGWRYRYPLKGSNEHIPRSGTQSGGCARCSTCRSPLRSSLESVNSAPGRMDNQDNLALGASALDPTGSGHDCPSPAGSKISDNESLVSGVARLDTSEENIGGKASSDISPASRVHRHMSDCVRPHSGGRRQGYPPGVGYRRPAAPTGPYAALPHPQACCHGNHRAPYVPSNHAKQLRVSDERCDQLPSPSVIKTPPPEFQDGSPGGRGCYDDCVSDSGTTMSGSYNVDTACVDTRHNNNMKSFRLPEGVEDGTCV